MVERLLCKQDAAGSSPAGSTRTAVRSRQGAGGGRVDPAPAAGRVANRLCRSPARGGLSPSGLVLARAHSSVG